MLSRSWRRRREKKKTRTAHYSSRRLVLRTTWRAARAWRQTLGATSFYFLLTILGDCGCFVPTATGVTFLKLGASLWEIKESCLELIFETFSTITVTCMMVSGVNGNLLAAESFPEPQTRYLVTKSMMGIALNRGRVSRACNTSVHQKAFYFFRFRHFRLDRR